MKSTVTPGVGLEVSVAAAAAAVGLTPATLRTWDHRYGLSPSARTSGGHRRYNDADLLRLRAVARLIDQGAPPSSAAEVVVSWTDKQCADLLKPARSSTPAANTTAATGLSQPQRSGGGRILPLVNPTDDQRGMARAAMALDGQSVRNMMAKAMESRGAVRAWEELAVPVLVALGDRWSRTASGVEIEHVTSQGIADALDVETAENSSGRPVMLCCAPNDQHALALLALRAALTEHNVHVVMLGAQLPVQALAAASIRLRPRAIVIWASIETHADLSALRELPQQRPPIRLFLAGPGWDGADTDDSGARVLRSLSEAVTELVRY